MTYRPSAPRLADVQAAVAKQGCNAKIALCGNGEEEREGCSIERAPTSDYIQ
jgi:hypothetical protein